ncbi:uncharacterized protein LOC100206280 [Hydra vulgaris]|uniref:Uncharacterized protein LOC100206280 n=1 Tax=Hydra vulgaris TaxID=6087 RepID=A0ABM4BER8_HYDVU
MVGRINSIAIDDSKTSELAFNWYVQHYHRSEDTLTIFHLQQIPKIPAMGLLSGSIEINDEYRAIIRDSVEKTRALLQKYKALCHSFNIEFKVVLNDSYSSPGKMIVDMAKSHNVDVIITGQRGLSQLSKFFLGSTSEYVLHNSHVPVIVIPPHNNSTE